jgi:aminopeptidase-like protein
MAILGVMLLAERLWPINISLTGPGVRQTFDLLNQCMPTLSRYQIQSGAKVFDWTVPREWFIKDAWIKTPNGSKICSVHYRYERRLSLHNWGTVIRDQHRPRPYFD